jgi:hypothetical protein
MRRPERMGSAARWALIVPVVLAMGCSGPAQEREPEEAAAVPAPTAAEVEAAERAEAERQNLADRRAERLAMEEVDAVFPHSEHRALECQRCHQRPAGHETHTDAPCNACHGRPAGFASLPERTPRECAACHHADVETRSCRSCHPSDQVGERPVLVAIRAAGAEEPRVRQLTFDHANHTTRECTSCHTMPATLRFGRECASCHDAHHRQEAECTACHVSVGAPAHDADVHEGCAECHGDAAVLALEPTRNVCLTCHEDMADHRAGQRCTACHIGSWPARPARGGGP